MIISEAKILRRAPWGYIVQIDCKQCGNPHQHGATKAGRDHKIAHCATQDTPAYYVKLTRKEVARYEKAAQA